MFDKIGRYAETVAASAGQSRRGFLGLLGKGALSLAGLVGALLVLPDEAGANILPGACYYVCPDGTHLATNCGNRCEPTVQHGGMTCTIYRSTCGYR